ncbi:hypothetical protein THIOKS12210039 [Thiocapsa sp. KS1]|nr:hypothetical protein THIOKS12210039 [Thiocapsa sp. KS1]
MRDTAERCHELLKVSVACLMSQRLQHREPLGTLRFAQPTADDAHASSELFLNRLLSS